MEDKTYVSIQNLPRISPSLLKDMDTSAPISYKARLGWEGFDLEHYIFDKEEVPEVCEKSDSCHCYFLIVLELKKPKNH